MTWHRYRSLGTPFHKERCAFEGCGEDQTHPVHQALPHDFDPALAGELECRQCGHDATHVLHRSGPEAPRP